MGISMWHIYSELRVGTATPLIQNGAPSIVDARLMLNADSGKGSVLVGNGADYFRSDVDVVIASGYDMIFVCGADLEEVFNDVCGILDRYRRWEAELEAAQNGDDGLQEMLDCSFSVIHHAMFIYGRDGKALAISSHYPPETHWLWRELVQTRGLTPSRMQSLKEDIQLTNVFQDARPTVRESSIDTSYKYMHCSLRVNGLVAGHLVLFSFDHPFERGLDHLVMKLVRHGEVFMGAHAERYALASDAERLVGAMLAGEQYAASALFDLLQERGWHLDDAYRVHVLRENVEGEPVLLTRAYLLLTQRSRAVITTRRGTSLMILENESGTAANESLACMFDHEPLLKENFICGTSAPFRNLVRCHEYYQQACEELDQAQSLRERCSRADDHSGDHFLRLLDSDPLAITYVRSDIVALYAYDQAHGTSYYETLRMYCLSGFQGTRTARLLGIHRNSLLYRLDRMREIIDFAPYDALAARPNMKVLGEVLASFILIDRGSANELVR